MSIRTTYAHQFKTLVRETTENKGICLSECAAYHLVDALVTHLRDEHIFIYPVSTLVEITQEGIPPATSFVINGDRCLLLVGLFAKAIIRKGLLIRDYISMGRLYYTQAQTHEPPSLDDYYESIIDEFENMAYTLQAMRRARYTN